MIRKLACVVALVALMTASFVGCQGTENRQSEWNAPAGPTAGGNCSSCR